MQVIDFRKELKSFYQPSAKEIAEVTVPSMNFLMIDGEGDPNTAQEYADAIEALYAVAYALKFMVKKGPMAIDYGVMPLEGLWWVDDMSQFSITDKSGWKWTMMIAQPDLIAREMVDQALADVKKKKNPVALGKMRFESLHEGLCAQIMHIGPFTEEGPVVERLHRHIDAKSRRRGKHHEIYLSDIRKAAPAQWKTVIRQPME